MAKASEPRADSNEAIGARLDLLRRAYSIAQGRERPLAEAEFARLCGITPPAFNNFAAGRSRIGLNNAIRVRAKTGAGLEFIYFGVRTLLPQAIDAAIDQIEQAEKPRPAKRA